MTGAVWGFAGALVVATISRLLSSCGSCGAPCFEPTTLVLKTEGYLVVKVASDCPGSNGSRVASEVYVQALRSEGVTCHVDATLDDGQVISMVIPMTKPGDLECCGAHYKIFEAATSALLMVSAKRGNLDA